MRLLATISYLSTAALYFLVWLQPRVPMHQQLISWVRWKSFVLLSSFPATP